MDRLLWFMYNHKLVITTVAVLELIKMIYVIFSSHFAFTRQPKILLIGFLDLICGVPGLLVVLASVAKSFPWNGEGSRSAFMEDLPRLFIVLSGFPSLTGILTVMVATSYKKYFIAYLVMFIRSIIIILLVGVIVVYTLFYINYHGPQDYSESEIYVYFFRHIYFFFGAPWTAAFAQVYFINVLVKFCDNEMRGNGEVRGGSSNTRNMNSWNDEGYLTGAQTCIVGTGEEGPKVVVWSGGMEF